MFCSAVDTVGVMFSVCAVSREGIAKNFETANSVKHDQFSKKLRFCYTCILFCFGLDYWVHEPPKVASIVNCLVSSSFLNFAIESFFLALLID